MEDEPRLELLVAVDEFVLDVLVLVHVTIDVVALADLLDECCSGCGRMPVLGAMDGGGFLRGGGVGGVSCRSIPS